MRVLIHSALFLMIASGPLPLAQSAAQPTDNQAVNTVSVTAEGTFETAPDTALFRFDITAQERTSEAAYARVSKAADAVRQALKAKNVDAKTAELSHYTVQPIVDWRSQGKRKVLAYKVTTSVSIKVHDLDKIGPLTEVFSQIDDAENQNVSYSLENSDHAKSKAVEDAMLRATSMAETVARIGHRSLGELSSASVDTVMRTLIVPRVMAYAALAKSMEVTADNSGGYTPLPSPTEDFTPKTISVSAHVNAIFTLK